MKVIITTKDEALTLIREGLPFEMHGAEIELNLNQTLPSVDIGDLEAIRNLIESGQQILAIKRFRKAYPNVGLPSAKDACDALRAAFKNERLAARPCTPTRLSYDVIKDLILDIEHTLPNSVGDYNIDLSVLLNALKKAKPYY